jgi:FkbH-like protein
MPATSARMRPDGSRIPLPAEGPAIVVAATFTAEPVEAPLQFWAGELGLELDIRFAPYNQIFQQVLDPGGLYASNTGGVNLALVRLEDWSHNSSGAAEALEHNVRHFLDALDAAAPRLAAPLVLLLCPDSPAFLALPENAAAAARAQNAIREEAGRLGSVYVSVSAEIERLYPVAEIHDPHADQLGHVPYTAEEFAALATFAARRIHALRTLPYKVIVLDCDDTLWRGICGEDGPEGIRMDEPRRALQEFMLEKRLRGMLLALASKNNEEDVLETFRANPEMPLRPGHFAAWRINWEPKSANLVSLAQELGLSLDSFILVDDNPKECAEVEADSPEALALLLPEDPAEIPRFLDHVWAFDRFEVTREDRTRAALYAQGAERRRLEKQASSLAEFLAALGLRVRIEPFAPEHLARVAQLTQRTNQMNLTGVRRTEAQVRALLEEGLECLTVEVEDRFGSYGLVGAMIFARAEDSLTLDTFLLSCRALGRGVEHRMLARLGEIAAERGLRSVDVPFVPLPRNRPALEFLRSAGARQEIETGSDLLFRFPAAELRSLEYRPGEARPAAAPEPAPASDRVARPAVRYAAIARELDSAGRVLEAMRKRARVAAATPAGVPPRTALESRLAAIWSRLLHVEAVGVEDDFFDLGGHSLVAVELLSEVRREFGVEFSLQLVYSGSFTVAELARAIELDEIGASGGQDYADLLAEIEGLSDEQARALLEREQGEA